MNQDFLDIQYDGNYFQEVLDILPGPSLEDTQQIPSSVRNTFRGNDQTKVSAVKVTVFYIPFYLSSMLIILFYVNLAYRFF